MSLPQKDFEWIEDAAERERLVMELPIMDIEGPFGFVVDLVIPDSIHEKTDDFPLAPEKGKVQKTWLTHYMESMLGDGRFSTSEKLLLTHLPKEHYIVHFALLQFCLKMGVQITCIHRIIKFKQSAFFEPYISYNSTQRQLATNNFAKYYYKLKNNALFGKTMEDVRGRMNMRLCQSPDRLITYTSKPLFKEAKFFSEQLVGVLLQKEEVELNKPIGQAVLDLSKLVMYRLRYERLCDYEERFGGSIRVLAGDTDSLMLEVTGISLANQLLPAMSSDDLLDCSNFP